MSNISGGNRPYILMGVIIILAICGLRPLSQTPSPKPTHADILRGEYGPYRSNNDLLSYALDIRIDPERKTINGKNTIRFRMLKTDTRIQIDLYDNLNVDKITLGNEELKYTRDAGAVFIDFPQRLKAAKTYAIDFYFSGTPKTDRSLGGLLFLTDPTGRPWIASTCEIGEQACGGQTRTNGGMR